MNGIANDRVGPMLNPPHLGELIRESMDDVGWNVTETAERLGCERGTLLRLLNGKAGVSANMALEDIGCRTPQSVLRAWKSIFDIWLEGCPEESMVGVLGFVFDGKSHITYIATVDHRKNTSRTSMPRLISAPFFSAHPVFRRAEYAVAVGRRPQDKVVTAMLAQHLRAGNLRRIARGVFASVPKHADAATWSVDRFLAASRLRHGGAIACHSALELHGCAYTHGHDVQVIAQGEPGMFEAVGFACRFVRPPRGFAPPDGVTAIDRLGLEVSVTTIERTIADLFDRYDLAGDSEELFNSLDLVARVDAAAVVRYARALGKATAAGALGFWLEREQKRLDVPDAALEELRTLMPSQPRYALGARSGEGRTARGWNVILPIDVVERRFEGL